MILGLKASSMYLMCFARASLTSLYSHPYIMDLPENQLSQSLESNERRMSLKEAENPKTNRDVIFEKGARQQVDLFDLVKEKRQKFRQILESQRFGINDFMIILSRFSDKIKVQSHDLKIGGTIDSIYKEMYNNGLKFIYKKNQFLNIAVFQNMISGNGDNSISYTEVADIFIAKIQKFKKIVSDGWRFTDYCDKIEKKFVKIISKLDELKGKILGLEFRPRKKSTTSAGLSSDYKAELKTDINNIISNIKDIFSNFEKKYENDAYITDAKLKANSRVKSCLLEILGLFNIISARILDLFAIIDALYEDRKDLEIETLNIDIFTDILVYLDLKESCDQTTEK